jgi:hypothetical protein
LEPLGSFDFGGEPIEVSGSGFMCPYLDARQQGCISAGLLECRRHSDRPGGRPYDDGDALSSPESPDSHDSSRLANPVVRIESYVVAWF